jgi:FKBP-type peptidyl-prolyl cis-trans isomerase (trigger factor)
MADHKTEIKEKITSVVAKEGNGNVQITFTIPFPAVKKAQDDTIAEMAGDMEIPGFRKGKAPIEKVREKIPQNQLIEHSLGHLLPEALADAVEEHKLKIAIYPKWELLSAKDGEDWQVKGTTCELPEVNLGDYKKLIEGAKRANKLWTPGKGEPDKPKEPTREDMENLVISTLLENIKVEIPQILIEDEADSRLSNLLSRIEKLGLALESYLASVNKKPEDLRAEYASQAKSAISLDLILNKIVLEEKIEVDEKELSEALSVAQASQPDSGDSEQRKRLLESILKRRKALDFLVQLA